jgi:DNA-directed RNA polymerase specialized sigma24 family protein
LGVDLAAAIALLPDAERRLLLCRLEQHFSYRELAALESQNISVVHRRVRQLLKRISDPVLAPLMRHCGDLDPRHREIAIRALVAGQSMRQICRELHLDRQLVRAAVAAARAWCEASYRSMPTCPRPALPANQSKSPMPAARQPALAGF